MLGQPARRIKTIPITRPGHRPTAISPSRLLYAYRLCWPREGAPRLHHRLPISLHNMSPPFRGTSSSWRPWSYLTSMAYMLERGGLRRSNVRLCFQQSSSTRRSPLSRCGHFFRQMLRLAFSFAFSHAVSIFSSHTWHVRLGLPTQFCTSPLMVLFNTQFSLGGSLARFVAFG